MNQRLPWGGVSSLALFLGLIFVVISPDLTVVSNYEDTFARKKQLLDRLNALPTQEAEIKDRLIDLGGDNAAMYLYSGEPNSISTFIQRDLRETGVAGGINYTSVRPLAIRSSEDRLSEHAVQVSFQTSNDQFVKFLDLLRNTLPILKIQKISVVVQSRSSLSKPAILSITMTVSGYSEKRGGS